MKQELLERLQDSEDHFTERKPEGVNAREIRKTLVAFANSTLNGRTAVLFIGISNNGDIIGISSPDELQKTIRSICENDCYPPIKYVSEILEKHGKQILAIVVSESQNGPHFSGPAFIRVGSESIVASEEIFNRLVDKRHQKVKVILEWKDRPITFVRHVKNSGLLYPKNSDFLDIPEEVTLADCNAHFITLWRYAPSRENTFPLDSLTISFDDSKQRLKLIIDLTK